MRVCYRNRSGYHRGYQDVETEAPMTRERRDFYLIQRNDRKLNGRPVYYCRFRDSTGQPTPWRSTRCTAKVRAEQWARQQIAGGKVGAPTDLAGYLLTFWDYEQSPYVRSKRAEGRELSPVYVKNSQNLLRDHVLPYLKHRGVRALTDLSKQVLLDWRNHLFENGCIKLKTLNVV